MNKKQKKLLLELFKIPAPSGKEVGVQVFIMNFLDLHNIPYHVDEKGNIFNILQDEKPLLSAHMDTVQRMKDCRNIKYITLKDNILKGQGVIGGDDKCGIFIILQLLKTRKELDFNFLFTVEEECGGHGSREFVEKQDLSHILYGLVLDRQGNGDILCVLNNYGSIEFEDALWLIGDEFGYKPNGGIFSDADYLKEWFSCANLSVGYYNAHTRYEYVNIDDLMKSYRYVNTILNEVKTYFPPSKAKLEDQSRFDPYIDYNFEYDYENSLDKWFELNK